MNQSVSPTIPLSDQLNDSFTFIGYYRKSVSIGAVLRKEKVKRRVGAGGLYIDESEK